MVGDLIMKKVYLDLETIGTSKDADITEFCALFVIDRDIVNVINEKIRINKDYDNLSEQEKLDLDFHEINCQEDIDNHNNNAIELKDVLNILTTNMARFGKIGISGWNNAGFDNIILEKHLISNGFDMNTYFDYHHRDIMHKIEPFQKFGYIKGLSLKLCHMELFGTLKEDDFHNAYSDCIATKDLDEWVEDILQSLVDRNAIDKGLCPKCKTRLMLIRNYYTSNDNWVCRNPECNFCEGVEKNV